MSDFVTKLSEKVEYVEDVLSRKGVLKAIRRL